MKASRAQIVSGALLIIGMLPQVVGACVATYLDYNIDYSEEVVQAWSWVEDCDMGWGGYYEHYYYASVNIDSPSSAAGDSDNVGPIPYAGGSADAYASISYDGDPGLYEVDLVVEILCSIAGPLIYEVFSQIFEVDDGSPVIVIFAPRDLWWFDGPTPPNYATSVGLISSAGGSTQWSISSGSGIVSLSQTSGTSTVVTSTGQSASMNDVTVTASAGGNQNDHDLTVFSPHELQPGLVDTECPTFPDGHHTNYWYTILDQFGSPMPNGALINEDWTTGVTIYYSGTNWSRAEPAGSVLSGSVFVDSIGAAHYTLPPNPSIDCESETLVHGWGQAFSVGSVTPGQGKLVQTNNLTRRRDRSFHTAVTSPP